MPATAICWTAYESFKVVLSRDDERIDPTKREQIKNEPYVIQPHVMIYDSSESNNTPRETDNTRLPSRELPLSIYTAINLKPMHTKRVFSDSSFK